MTTQDIEPRLDITGQTEVSGTSLNQLVSTATFADDKGIQIETTDTAADTPVVPNPAVELEGITPTFWTRYIWKRISFTADERVKTYQWNPQITTPDPTYLKWEVISIDESALALAQEALDAAEAAQTTADTAQTAATNASAAAAAAQATANSAQTTANTNTSSIASLNTDLIDTGLALASLTLNFNSLVNTLTRIPLAVFHLWEQQNSGDPSAVASVAGVWTTRCLNEIEDNNSDYTSKCTLNIGTYVFTLQPGVYEIDGEFPAAQVSSGGFHKAKLYNVTTAADELFGTSEANDTTSAATKSRITGILSIAVATQFRIDHKVQNDSTTAVFGTPASMGPEIYSTLKISYLGAL